MKREGTITFDSSLKKEILDMFGIIPNSCGFLIEKDEPHLHIIENGEWLHINEFAGIMRDPKTGGVKVVTNDIVSLIELSDKFKGE